MLGNGQGRRATFHQRFTGSAGQTRHTSNFAAPGGRFLYAHRFTQRHDVRMSRRRCATAVLAATAMIGASGPGATRAQAALSFQPELGSPGLTTLLGGSPGEAPGEVWAIGEIGAIPATVGGQLVEGKALMRHSQGTGWQIVPLIDRQGEALAVSGTPKVTYDGGVVTLEDGPEPSMRTIATRDPGGGFELAPVPKGELLGGESLFSTASGPPLFAAIDDTAHTGALIVPAGLSSTEPGVLHYDGEAGGTEPWTREPLCTALPTAEKPCKAPSQLTVGAIAAGSPQSAWLLASRPGEPAILFRRTATSSGSMAWVQSSPVSWAGGSVALRESGQMLTATSQGLWVDLKLDGTADLSVLLDAASPSTVLGRWCYPHAFCKDEGGGSLGAGLPDSYSSFAWDGGGLPGTRIVAGIAGGGLLDFQRAGDFQYEPGGGLETATAAFTKSGESPPEGWIAGISSESGSVADVERVSASPEPSPLSGAQALAAALPAPAAGDRPRARHDPRRTKRPSARRRRRRPDRPILSRKGVDAGIPLQRAKARSRDPACAAWRGRNRAAPTRSATKARCCSGAPTPVCGNPIRRRPWGSTPT